MRMMAMVGLCLVGCASAPPAKTTMTVTHLTPEIAPMPANDGRLLTFAVAPVQLGSFAGLVAGPSGERIPLAVRVPQRGAVILTPTIPLHETPGLIENHYTSYFDRRTIPLVPFAGFWVGIGNQSDAEVVIASRDLVLVAGGKRFPVIADPGALYGRFRRTVVALGSQRLGQPLLYTAVDGLQRSLPFLGGEVRLAPRGQWQGYVVFDVGAFTADEYDAFLRDAGAITVSLTAPGSAPSTVSFSSERRDLSTVCLPRTPTPSFARCEVLP